MGKIPRYQTKKLASEVVGTPGIDTSTADFFQSLSQGVGQVAQVAFSNLKARQQALDSVEADAKATDFSLNYLQQLGDLKTASVTDPMGAVIKSKELGATLANANLSNIKSETVRAAVSRLQQREIRKQGGNMIKWAFHQQNENAFVNLTGKMNNLAAQARVVDNSDQLQDIFDEASRSIATATNVVKDPSAFIESNMKNIAAGFLYGQIERNPLQAGALLRGGMLDKFFSQSEREKWQKDIESSINKRAEEVSFNNLFDTALAYSDMAQQYAEGTLPLDSIDRAIADGGEQGVAPEQIQALETLREITLSSKNLTVADNAEGYSNVWDEFNKLGVTKDGESATARLQNFYKFQNIVTQAFNDGTITAADFNFFMKKTASVMQNKIAEVTGDKTNLFKQEGFMPGLGNLLTPQVRTSLDIGYRKINNYVQTSRKGDLKAKGRLLKQLSNQISLKEDFEKRDMAEAEISLLADQLIIQEVISSNKYLEKIPPEGTLLIHSKTGHRKRVLPDYSIKLEK